jgi:translocation and assembly module TamB
MARLTLTAKGLDEVPDAIAANLIWDGKICWFPSLQVGNCLTANGKVDLAFPNNSPQSTTHRISGLNYSI